MRWGIKKIFDKYGKWRSIFLAFLVMLAGCASVETAGPGSRSVELHLCLYNSKSNPADSGKDRGISVRLGPFFQSVSMVSSKNDTTNCDLLGEVAQPSVFKPPHIDVYSAYSKKFLMRAVSQNYADWRYEGPLYDAFNKDAPLYAHVVAEREGSQKQAASDTASKSELKALVKEALSDVDELPAVKAKPNKNAYAIVIGIENYRQKLPKADFATHDAQTMTEYLTKVMGYPEENIVTLLNDRATFVDLVKYFEKWLSNNVEKDGSVFIYYSGHGAPNPKTGDAFLVPYDGDPAFIDQTGYSLKRLYDNLGKLQVSEVTVVLDACFSGAGGRSVIAKGARPLVMTMEKTAIPSNVAVLSAASGDQISSTYEEKGHGLFTYFMLKGIKGEGDINGDGKIEIRELFEYLKPQVERVARKTYNNEQSPQIIAPTEKHKMILIEGAK